MRNTRSSVMLASLFAIATIWSGGAAGDEGFLSRMNPWRLLRSRTEHVSPSERSTPTQSRNVDRARDRGPTVDQLRAQLRERGIAIDSIDAKITRNLEMGGRSDPPGQRPSDDAVESPRQKVTSVRQQQGDIRVQSERPAQGRFETMQVTYPFQRFSSVIDGQGSRPATRLGRTD